MNVIETFELSKTYGQVIAVDQVSLAVASRTILALVGPDKAGKSSLLRMLATLTAPTSGDATIANYSITGNPARVRRLVGYMPTRFGQYPDMTVSEYLRFYARCYGVPYRELHTLIADLLQLVDLSHRRNDALSTLSTGAMQRLSLARALAHDPQVLLLDEPIARMDPRAHVVMRELVRELRNMGKTIVLTAPIVADVSGLCTHLAFMESGKITLSGTFEEVHSLLDMHRTITVRFFGSVDLALEILRTMKGVMDIKLISSGEEPSLPSAHNEITARVVVTVLKQVRLAFSGSFTEASDMIKTLMRSGIQVVSFSEEPDTVQSLLERPGTWTDEI